MATVSLQGSEAPLVSDDLEFCHYRHKLFNIVSSPTELGLQFSAARALIRSVLCWSVPSILLSPSFDVAND